MASEVRPQQSVEGLTIARVELVEAPYGLQDHGRERAARIRSGLAGWKVSRVVAHIDARLPGRVSVADLARIAGLTRDHFGRAFKQTFGVSGRTFIRRLRIELAQGMMLSTELPLREIALRCGLCGQPHLSRMFRHIVGEAPSTWRRARAEPDAAITFIGGNVAAGIGHVWGRGGLVHAGKSREFSISGLSLVDAGAANTSATGEVYCLQELADLPGKYVEFDAGWARAARGTAAYLRNERGVVIKIVATTAGLRFKLAAGGVEVKFTG